jgi:putative hydrolase of the HAD superfamily
VSFRAVVFDLYQTLVPYDSAIAERGYRRMAAGIGVPDAKFVELWRRGRPLRDTGPLDEYLSRFVADLDVDASAADPLLQIRRADTRALLQPDDSVVYLLDDLRRRGKRLGVVSVCSEELADVWSETPLGRRFDAVAFSCVLGVTKPDPAIYLHVCDLLETPPEGCLYVGDGANDELRGAEAVGMTAVQLLVRAGEPPWGGPTIESLAEVADLA